MNARYFDQGWTIHKTVLYILRNTERLVRS